MSTSPDYSTFLERSELVKMPPNARAVLNFWFDPEHEACWFAKDDDFDQQIAQAFGDIWQAAIQGECAYWRRVADSDDGTMANLAGRLAEIIVLDQFSRNLQRGQAAAFAQDGMALVLAQEAVCQPDFAALPTQWRKFMILPFMHSESRDIHERYLPLFKQLDDAQTLDFAYQHKAIIDKFGRYPHRNAVLDRESTAAEEDFLQQPNSSF